MSLTQPCRWPERQVWSAEKWIWRHFPPPVTRIVTVTNFHDRNGAKPAGKTDAEDGEIEDGKDGKENDRSVTAMQGVVSGTPASLRPDRQRNDRPSTPDVSSTAQRPPPKTDSRPSTPAGTGAPPVAGSGRATPSQLPGNRPAGLPPRPDGPIPSQNQLHPRNDRLEGRPPYGRHDSRPGEQFGRLERPGERPNEAARELMLRRETSPGQQSRGRTPDVHPQADRDRREPGYGPPRDARDLRDPRERDMRDLREPHPRDPRDMRDSRDMPRDLRDPRNHQRQPLRDSPRDLRDGGRSDSRGPEWDSPRGRPGSDPYGPMPYDSRARQQQPPLSMRPPVMPPRDDRPPTVNSERTAPTLPATQPPAVAVNPERLALINQELSRDQRDSRDASRKAELSNRIEREREAGRNQQRTSRPQSPRRDDRPPPRSEALHDDRRNERAPASGPPVPSPTMNSRDRREDANAPPPSGPRVDQMGRGGGAAGRGRELFSTQQAPPRQPIDPNHGRLNSQGFDSRTQDPNYGRLNAAPDVPSGPRGRGNMQQRGGRNFTAPQPPGSLRTMEPSSPAQPPLSPNQERMPPSGPLSDRDRRDRRQTTGADQPQAPPSAPQGPAADQPSGIHPSRMSNLSNPLQANAPTAPANHGAPSGPRSAGHRQTSSINMTAPSPTARNPPTGPSSATGSGPKEDVRFAGMKNILIKAQGASVRGQAGRANNGRYPQTQSPIEPPPPPPPPQEPPKRPDLMEGRPSRPPAEGSTNEERSESRGGRRSHGDRERKRHRSRSRSPRREAVENSRQRDEPPRDREREKRHEGANSDRDEKGHRRSRGGEHNRERDRERERREPRGARESFGAPQQQAPIPPPPPPPPPQEERRSSRGGHERDRQPRRDEGRKRPRNDEAGLENKRPRRTQ